MKDYQTAKYNVNQFLRKEEIEKAEEKKINQNKIL